MMAACNTTIDVLRGDGEDIYGDDVETELSTTYRRLPASLIEQTKTSFDPVSGNPRIIRYSICRVQNGSDIQQSDRIRDNATNLIYGVESITTPTGPTIAADMRIDLVRVD